MPRKPAISKSAFIRGRQCLKSLYLVKYLPELRDPISAEQQALFDRGHTVGELAQQLFPGGVMAAFELPEGFMKSIFRTRNLIDQGQEIIYEAGFMVNSTHCFVDILVRDGLKWKVYEVKSSSSISEVYFYDAAFQHRVLTQSGLEISDFSIVHVKENYVSPRKPNIQEMFSITSVIHRVMALKDEVNILLSAQFNTLLQKNIPDIPTGAHCTNPYNCDFFGHCHQKSDHISEPEEA